MTDKTNPQTLKRKPLSERINMTVAIPNTMERAKKISMHFVKSEERYEQRKKRRSKD